MPKSTGARAALADVRPKTAATIFVCSQCATGSARRRELKCALKAAGGKRELRVVSCRCLDICPKRGVAAVLMRDAAPARPIVIDAGAGGSEILSLLLR